MSPLLTPAGARVHRVLLENPSGRVPDNDGGYTYTWAPLNPPEVYARIQHASVRDLERTIAETVTTVATHLVTIPYHPQVTRATRITFNGRTFQVVAQPANKEELDRELDLVCAELVPTGPVPVSVSITAAADWWDGLPPARNNGHGNASLG